MKRINTFFIAVALLWPIISCARSSEPEPQKQNPSPSEQAVTVTWYNFNEGIKMAQKMQRPVIMDFYADWCGWCRKMELEVFSDPEIATKLKNNYVCIRIHTDRQLNEVIRYKNHTLSKEELSAMLGVQGLPTVVFMDREANFITKIPGFINKKILLPLLAYIDEKCYLNKVSFDDYMDGKAPCNKKK